MIKFKILITTLSYIVLLQLLTGTAYPEFFVVEFGPYVLHLLGLFSKEVSSLLSECTKLSASK